MFRCLLGLPKAVVIIQERVNFYYAGHYEHTIRQLLPIIKYLMNLLAN